MKCPMCNYETSDPDMMKVLEQNLKLLEMCESWERIAAKQNACIEELVGYIRSAMAESENPAREVVSNLMEELLKDFNKTTDGYDHAKHQDGEEKAS